MVQVDHGAGWTDGAAIPKWWRDSIAIPDDYPPQVRGQLARPCVCGQPTSLEGDRVVHLIMWKDGTLMFAHEDCVGGPDANL